MERSKLEKLEKTKSQDKTETSEGFIFCPRCCHVMTGNLVNSFCPACGYRFCPSCSD